MHLVSGLLAAGDLRSADVSHYLACTSAFQDCRRGGWRSPSVDLGLIRTTSETGSRSLTAKSGIPPLGMRPVTLLISGQKRVGQLTPLRRPGLARRAPLFSQQSLYVVR